MQQAQLQFNRWLALEDAERTPSRLLDMLGFDYFKLLDLLTIARSRKHIEKYYGTVETGKFPERLKPINIKPDVDLSGEFRSIEKSTMKFGGSSSLRTPHSDTCCRTNRRHTMLSTALRFEMAKAPSGKSTAKKASSICCV